MTDGLIRVAEWIYEKFEQHILPFVVLKPYEQGVLLRLGKYRKNLKPGLRFKIPLLDYIHTCIVTLDTYNINNITITTLDQKSVVVGVVIELEISDIRKYLLDFNDTPTNAKDLIRGIVTDYLTDCNWDEIRKRTTLTQVKNKCRDICSPMGIDVKRVVWTNIILTRSLTIFKDSSTKDNTLLI